MTWRSIVVGMRGMNLHMLVGQHLYCSITSKTTMNLSFNSPDHPQDVVAFDHLQTWYRELNRQPSAQSHHKWTEHIRVRTAPRYGKGHIICNSVAEILPSISSGMGPKPSNDNPKVTNCIRTIKNRSEVVMMSWLDYKSNVDITFSCCTCVSVDVRVVIIEFSFEVDYVCHSWKRNADCDLSDHWNMKKWNDEILKHQHRTLLQ